MHTLLGKTIIVTGASRGIGAAIAIKCGQAGANVVVCAKTAEPHPTLPGTIHTIARQIESAGGQALPFQIDVRNADSVQQMVQKVSETFGGIDALINNAGVLNLTGTLQTPMKRFDLMCAVNVRATFCASQACIPFLRKSTNPHIINISPPLNLKPKWFKNHLAYTISKYGMSMCTLGMSAEFAEDRIAVNSLWPKSIIATQALIVHFPEEAYQKSRKPEIMADAAYQLLITDSSQSTGNFFTDEDVLRSHGWKDFSKYAIDEHAELINDGFLD